MSGDKAHRKQQQNYLAHGRHPCWHRQASPRFQKFGSNQVLRKFFFSNGDRLELALRTKENVANCLGGAKRG